MRSQPPRDFGPDLNRSKSDGDSSRRPLRIVADLSWLRPGGESGGIKPFALEYLRELAALESDRLVLIFLTWSCSHAEVRLLARAQDELVCVRHTEPAPPADLCSCREGELFIPTPPPDLLLRLKADLLYIPVGPPQFACPGIPTISTIADVLHREYPSTLTPENNAMRETIFAYLVSLCDRFQCISHYTAERLHQYFSVPLAQTFCSYIPIHQRLASFTKENQASILPVPYFFYPANSWKHKNHETLLVAYHHYCAQDRTGSTWDLVLTGFLDDRMSQVLAIAESLGIKERVHFLGHLPDRDFSRVWLHAGALIFPSLHEGFGIPLLEAMHFGVPILCSDAGSLGEVAGDAALFADARDPVAWAEAMYRIAHDETLRSDYISRGRRRLTEFSLAGEIAEFRDVLAALAAQRDLKHWHKGIHSDGWLGKMAIMCLPESDGAIRISLRLAAASTARRLLVRVGMTTVGDFDVPAQVATQFDLEVDLWHRSLVLEVPEAEKDELNDPRSHGVVVKAVLTTDTAGRTHILFEAKS